MSRLRDAWRLLHAPCREIARLASASLDRDLDRLEWLACKSHQLGCTKCRRYARQIALIHAVVARLAARADPDLGPTLPAEVRVRIQQALTDRSSPA